MESAAHLTCMTHYQCHACRDVCFLEGNPLKNHQAFAETHIELKALTRQTPSPIHPALCSPTSPRLHSAEHPVAVISATAGRQNVQSAEADKT